MLSNYFPFFVPTLVVNNTAMPRFASILFEAILTRFVREPTGGEIEERKLTCDGNISNIHFLFRQILFSIWIHIYIFFYKYTIRFLPDPGVSGVRSMGLGLSMSVTDVFETLLM